jgi:membrane-bound lytic murein transglycosylase B
VRLLAAAAVMAVAVPAWAGGLDVTAAAAGRPSSSPTPAGASGAGAAGAGASGAGAKTVSAADLQAQADAMATRLAQVTRQYREAVAATAAARTDLADAFGISQVSEQQQSDAEAALQAAQLRQSMRIRRLYTQGSLGISLTVLDADSTEDALWRMSTLRWVGRALLRQDGDVTADAHQRAQQAAAVAETTAAAQTRLELALGRMQDQAALAEQSLQQAKQQLATLRAVAGAAALAEKAAQDLAAAQALAQVTPSTSGPVAALEIPSEYLTAYQGAAATCPGMRWTLLAGVGQVESGHGRNNGPSSAGAVGPMQFMPQTFRGYAVDGDHDGRTDPWDPQDAIFTAAHYLCVSGVAAGGPNGVHQALLAYNHAEWYVDLVIGAERSIVARYPAGAATTP